MEERFKAVIDADVKGLEAGIAESEKILKRLESKLLGIKTRLETAFDEKSQNRLQAELKETERAITNVRGRIDTMSASLQRQSVATNNAAQSQQRFNRAVGNGNGVAIEFNRIIQDAPFGLIGIGNNIQQLTQNFATLKASAGSTGSAIRASLASLISPANLVVLGISAITAAFTAYQLGAFNFAESTNEAKKSQDEFNESLKNTDRILQQGFLNQLLKDKGLLRTENLAGRLIDVPAFENAQQVLEKLGSTINGLTKKELEALATFLGEKLADSTRAASNANTELEKSLALQDFGVYEGLLRQVNKQLAFYKTNTDDSNKSQSDSNRIIDEQVFLMQK